MFLLFTMSFIGLVLSLQISTVEKNFLQDYSEQRSSEDIVIIIEKGMDCFIAQFIQNWDRFGSISTWSVETDAFEKKWKSVYPRISIQVIARVLQRSAHLLEAFPPLPHPSMQNNKESGSAWNHPL